MRDFSNDLTEIRRRVSEAFVYLKVEAGGERMKVLEIDVARPDLWDDQDNAKKSTPNMSISKQTWTTLRSCRGR